MKDVGVKNVGVMTISVKYFLGQQKVRKTPLSVVNAIFTYLNISKMI